MRHEDNTATVVVPTTSNSLTCRRFKCFVEQKSRIHLSNPGGSQSCGWTDGDSLRRRVDNIAEAIAQDLRTHDGTQLHGGSRFRGGARIDHKEGEKVEEKKKRDERIADRSNHGRTAADIVSHQTGANSSAEQRHQQITPAGLNGDGSGSRLPPTLALDAGRIRDELSVGLVGALGATEDSTPGQPTGVAAANNCAAGNDNMRPPKERKRDNLDGGGVLDTPGLRSIDASCLSDAEVSTRLVRVDASPTAGGGRNDKSMKFAQAEVVLGVEGPAKPASNAALGAVNSSTHGVRAGISAMRMSRRRPRPRPASATDKTSGNGPNSSFCVRGVRLSVSSPGLLQGSHNPGQSLAAIVDIAEAWEYPDGREARVLSGEAKVVAKGDVGLAACDVVRDATASEEVSRVGCDDGDGVSCCSAVDDIRGDGGQENGNSCTSTLKVVPEYRTRGELGRGCPADAAFEDGAATRRRDRLLHGGSEPGAAAVARAGCVPRPQLSMRTASLAVSTEVETPLQFRKAAVKLKVSKTMLDRIFAGNCRGWHLPFLSLEPVV